MLSPGPRRVGAPDGRGGCAWSPEKGGSGLLPREQAASARSSRSGPRTAACPPLPREEGRTAPGRRHNLSALKARGRYSATFGGCPLPNPTRGDRNHHKACSPGGLLVFAVPPALSPKASPILLPRPASGAWPLRSKPVTLETPHPRHVCL